MPIDILCVGHATYDLSFFVEAYPAENTKCETNELLECGGGPAANAACLVSQWGAGCAFAGLVGDDGYGRRVQEEFQRAGTDVSLLELRAGHATPVSMIVINKQNGSRTIVNRKTPGGSLRINPGAYGLMAPQVLLFDGHEPEASLAALQAFPNAISILDAGSWREGTAALAGRVDYLAASTRFALQATGLESIRSGHDRRECVRILREKYRATIVVTIGEDGLVADDGGGYFWLPAYPAQAVDTTAAGDIFHGAFAYGIAKMNRPMTTADFQEALKFASMAASLSVRKAGGRQSIPSLAEVKEALADVK